MCKDIQVLMSGGRRINLKYAQIDLASSLLLFDGKCEGEFEKASGNKSLMIGDGGVWSASENTDSRTLPIDFSVFCRFYFFETTQRSSKKSRRWARCPLYRCARPTQREPGS
jgi:hypothetical protein